MHPAKKVFGNECDMEEARSGHFAFDELIPFFKKVQAGIHNQRIQF
jgi:hypothetical protein